MSPACHGDIFIIEGNLYRIIISNCQFPTIGGFICDSPWLLSDLHGVVPDYSAICMAPFPTATQQFVWHRSRLLGDLYVAVHSYSAICMAQFPTVGRFYAAVHSYSTICMAQFPTVGRFTLCLVSYLHGTVPDCQEIYTMATQQFVWHSSRLSGNFYVAAHGY